MLFGKKPFRVRPLTTVAGPMLPWRADGLLVSVENAEGSLRWTEGPGARSPTRRALMLGQTPLLEAEADGYWCPTCEKLLALGYGRENVDADVLARLRQASMRPERPLAEALGDLEPVLRLLEDGVYLLSWVRHSPTNGQGLPFWALSRDGARLSASKDWLFGDPLFRVAEGFPAFLLPTQGLGTCAWARVEAYRAQLRAGEPLGALALWVDGFLSALLDGHHRATAALLEGAPLSCLTIVPQMAVGYRDDEKTLLFWDARIPFRDLPPEVVRQLEQQRRLAPAPAELPESSEQDAEPWRSDPHWPDLTLAAARFPNAAEVAATQVVGDVTQARLDGLFAEGAGGAAELGLVLQALSVAKDARAVDLALRIARAPMPDAWEPAFRVLAGVRSQEVEDFFVEFLIRDEGERPWLTRIADAYLAR